MMEDIIKMLNEIDEAIRAKIQRDVTVAEREALKHSREHVQEAITSLLGH